MNGTLWSAARLPGQGLALAASLEPPSCARLAPISSAVSLPSLVASNPSTRAVGPLATATTRALLVSGGEIEQRLARSRRQRVEFHLPLGECDCSISAREAVQPRGRE